MFKSDRAESVYVSYAFFVRRESCSTRNNVIVDNVISLCSLCAELWIWRHWVQSTSYGVPGADNAILLVRNASLDFAFADL